MWLIDWLIDSTNTSCELRLPVLNAQRREQPLVRGTDLGIIYEVATPKRMLKIGCIKEAETKTCAKDKAIEHMINGLPAELTEEQRRKVKDLLSQYRGIFSTGDHDIGRTHLVEHTIDTGDHIPIRQLLRRQPSNIKSSLTKKRSKCWNSGS